MYSECYILTHPTQVSTLAVSVLCVVTIVVYAVLGEKIHKQLKLNGVLTTISYGDLEIGEIANFSLNFQMEFSKLIHSSLTWNL